MSHDDADDFAFRVESRLMSQGVYVDEVDEGDGSYHISYESMAAEEGAIPHREAGRVINVLRDLHDDDWRGADVDAVVMDLEGNELGRWHVDAEWLAALHDGELSEVEFSEKVIGTIETTGEP